MDALTAKTPSGRIRNMPLRNPRHEAAAHAFVQGKTGREAGLAAGYKDGPGLKGNMARLRLSDAMQERIGELAKHSAALAEIYDGWVLADLAKFARGSLARFWQRDENGKLVLNALGHPTVDFSRASDDDHRLIKEFSYTNFGPKLVLHDPLSALDKLGRYRGLWSGDTAVAIANAETHYVISDQPMSEEEWERTRARPAEQPNE